MGSRPPVLEAGVTLGGRYRVDEHIASGGMSEVWQATDVTLGRRVAVKVLPPALVSDPDFTARFRAEARLMAVLHHPGIADVYDVGESELPTGGQALYLVMEHVEGQPLSRRVAEAGRLAPDAVLLLVARAAQALHVAHQHGIVHRDVKPGNLLVTPDGNVVLVDFGVARSAAVTAITSANAVVGTALYMAPEQAAGRAVSPATDIYSLGASAYHCLAGQPPFPGDNPLEVAFKHVHDPAPALPDDIPEPVRALVERAMAKDPGRRHRSALEFASAAVEAMSPDAEGRDSAFARSSSAFPLLTLAGTRTPAGPEVDPGGAGGPGPVEPYRRPRRVLIGAAAGVLVAAVAGVALMLRPSAADTTHRVEHVPTVTPGGPVPPPASASAAASLGGISGAGDGWPAPDPSAAPPSVAPSGTGSPSAPGAGATTPAAPTTAPAPPSTGTTPTGSPPASEPPPTATPSAPV